MVAASRLGLLAPVVLTIHAAEQQHSLNPIRKVVSLLQAMQKKVAEEGKREHELYDKYMCFCQTGSGDLSGSISGAKAKIPAVSSDIEEAEAKLSGAKASLKEAQTSRTAAKGAMAQATAIREKEAAAFAKYKAAQDTDTAAVVKAVAALSSGVAGSFLQTPAARNLQSIVSRSDLTGSDQEAVSAFLSEHSEYAPQSGEIIGILKQLGGTMAENLAAAIAEEKAAITTYEGLIAAKEKEVEALTATVESKTQEIGELGVKIVTMQQDLSDTQDSLAEDQQFLAELEKGCSTKTAEWEERSKTRSEELVALADTIKVLNDDDALELFKSTLPSSSASLLQIQATATAQRSEAMAAIRSAKASAGSEDRPGLEFIALALNGKNTGSGFGKVVKLIDAMVGTLKQEQDDDTQKKEYCAKEFDSSDDTKKSLERTVANEGAAVASTQEAIATLTQEIAAVEAGIRALDKSVTDATAQRKDESAEYKDLLTSNTAAKELLAYAKNRLNKFYNPKLYKAPAKAELSSGDRIYSSMGNPGGELTTAAPSGIAGTGIAVLAQVSVHKQQRAAPGAPPETWGAYATKSGETSGVIAMLDLLVKDLDKELWEAETSEKDAQSDYAQLMKDSAAKRTTDVKVLAAKTSAKADAEADLQAHTDAKAAGGQELMAIGKYIASLHGECDWLLQYFDVRAQARADEVESLKRAKAVLSGADYSLLQRD